MTLIQIDMDSRMDEIVRWYCALENISSKKKAIRLLIISYGKEKLNGYVKMREE